ncbi:unnamed protein product [Cunninghamella blakesleeana]
MMSTLSIKDATGRQISLLNNNQQNTVTVVAGKRKYHCIEPGCNKSFTTSGHLARHHRIHTGEKNFQCRYPGCPSRFSRQDNMMQHYRTHLSPKSRRQQQQQQKKNKVTKQTSVPTKLQCQTKSLKITASTDDQLNNKSSTHFTRPRRAVTLPSSFESFPFDNHPLPLSTSPISMNDTTFSSFHHHNNNSNNNMTDQLVTSPTSSLTSMSFNHHHLPPLIQPLPISIKPIPMEPVSTSPIISPTLHHQRRPQRAHSTSSTCSTISSSSTSFLSPPLPPSLSPLPISPPHQQKMFLDLTKPMIHLPPPPHFDSHGNNHHFDLNPIVSTFC